MLYPDRDLDPSNGRDPIAYSYLVARFARRGRAPR